MKRFFKKVTTLLLAVTLIFSSVAIGVASLDFSQFTLKAEAVQEEDSTKVYKEGNFFYTVKDGKATITDFDNESFQGDLVIPSMLGGYPVKVIGARAFQGYSGKNIVISYGIEIIEPFAFEDSTGVESVSIPNSVTTIKDHAFIFAENSNLTQLHLPASVVNLSDWALSTRTLEKVTVDPENPKFVNDEFGVLYDKNFTELIYYPHNSKQTSYSVREGVKKMGLYAFTYCPNIKTIILPSTLSELKREYVAEIENLEKYVVSEKNDYFSTDENGILFDKDKTKLISCPIKSPVTEYDIPDTVKTIYGGAFRRSANLKKINIPEGVEVIGTDAFRECSNLESVTIPESVSEIGGSAFSGSGVKKAVVPGKLDRFHHDVFSQCQRLEEVVLGEGITVIPFQTFNLCTNLKKVTLPDSLIEIQGGAFKDCEKLTEITIGKNVKTIESEAFYSCSKLEKVMFSDSSSLEYIGKWAFGVCPIQEIDIPDSAQAVIYDEAFYHCYNLKEVHFGSGVKEIGKRVFPECTKLESISVSSDNQYFFSDEQGILYNKDKTKIIQYPAANSQTDYTIPDTVTSIDTLQFFGCVYLKNIHIPQSVTEIKQLAFDGQSLEYISVDSANEFFASDEYGVLYTKDFSNLIRFPAGSKVTEYTISSKTSVIGGTPFDDCSKLEKLVLPENLEEMNCRFNCCYSLAEIIIPDSVFCVPGYIFSDTALYKNESNWENGVLYIGNHLISSNDKVASEYKVKPGTVSVASDAFSGNKNINKIIIPESVVNIGDNAFSVMHNLIEFEIPPESKLRTIGYRAFASSKIESIVLPESIETIQEEAFAGCSELSEIYLPDTLRNIEPRAFLGTAYWNDPSNWENDFLYINNHLIYFKANPEVLEIKDGTVTIADNFRDYNMLYDIKKLVVPDSLVVIGKEAFNNCGKLSELNIGSGSNLAVIKDRAFSNSKITSLNLPDTLQTIGDYAVYHTAIKTLFLPESTIYVGQGAFSSCYDLTDVTISGNLKTIEDETFERCMNLKTVNIANGVESVGNKAFYECSALQSINIPASVKKIGEYAFTYCYSLENVLIPSVCEIGKAAFLNCDSLKTITIPEGVSIIRRGTFESCDSLTKVTFPNTLEVIEDQAFMFCQNLASTDLPDGIKSIGREAFLYCRNLKAVHIPSSLTNIAGAAFGGCSSVVSITVDPRNEIYCSDSDGVLFSKDKTELIQYPAGNPRKTYTVPDYVEVIGARAFEQSRNLINVFFKEDSKLRRLETLALGNCYSLTAVTLPDGLEYIGNSSVCGNNLKSISVPDSVTHIEGNVLGYSGDYGKKTDIYYEGSKSQWIKIHGAFSPEEEEFLFDYYYQFANLHYNCGKTVGTTTEKDSGVLIEYFKEDYEGTVSVTVTETSTEEADTIVNSLFPVNAKVYDITINVDGEPVQPNGTVTVKIPLPEGYIPQCSFILHLNTETGKYEFMPAKYISGYLVFETDHFSYYAVVELKNTTVKIKNNNGSKTINYGDSLKLTAEATYIPDNAQIVWYVDGIQEHIGETFTVSPSGSVTVTVKIVDENGNVATQMDGSEASDSQVVHVKSGFFQKLISFFKNLFGISRIVEQIFKPVF